MSCDVMLLLLLLLHLAPFPPTDSTSLGTRPRGERAHVAGQQAGQAPLLSLCTSSSPLNNAAINLQSRLSDGKAHWSSNSFA